MRSFEDDTKFPLDESFAERLAAQQHDDGVAPGGEQHRLAGREHQHLAMGEGLAVHLYLAGDDEGRALGIFRRQLRLAPACSRQWT